MLFLQITCIACKNGSYIKDLELSALHNVTLWSVDSLAP